MITFFGLEFQTNPQVFTPYKEAEFLVDIALQVNPISVLDLGTGIGNIAISIAKNIPDAKVIGTDISEEELKVAEENAKLHQVEDRVVFKKSDLLASISHAPHLFISNLPFLPAERAQILSKRHEPLAHLDGGPDGFDVYRKLFVQMIDKNLYPKYLVAEIDYTQMVLAIQVISKYFPHCKADILRDHKRKVIALLITF